MSTLVFLVHVIVLAVIAERLYSRFCWPPMKDDVERAPEPDDSWLPRGWEGTD